MFFRKLSNYQSDSGKIKRYNAQILRQSFTKFNYKGKHKSPMQGLSVSPVLNRPVLNRKNEKQNVFKAKSKFPKTNDNKKQIKLQLNIEKINVN